MTNRYSNQNPTPTAAPSTDLQDKILNCRDCPAEFVFTAREQAFYAENNYTPPRGCKPCRDARKAQRNGAAPSSGYSAAPAPVVETYAGGGAGRKDRGRRNNDDDFDSGGGGSYRRRR
jgi:hypothetical protein